MAEAEEKVVLEFRDVKYKKELGVLVLTSLRVAWAPGDIVQTFQADFPYQQIKAQRISTETSSKVQLQLVLHAGDQAKFHFTGPNALQERLQVKEHLARVISKALSVPISAELEAKNKLLKSSPSLYQLYKDLVTTGLISAEEFWANHAQTRDNPHAQESGLPSAFLADIQAEYDGCNAVRYNLSTDVIQAIFRTYPGVKKRHSEMVPQQLKEEEFWTQFFQAHFFHHENRSNDFIDHLQDTQSHSTDVILPEMGASILKEEGYGVIPECRNSTTPLSLIQRCNYHSSRVLEALQEGSTQLPPSTAKPVSSTQSQMQLRPHHIQSNTQGSDTLFPLAQTLSSWKIQQVVPQNTANSALHHLTPGGLLMTGGCGQKASTVLTAEQQQEVFRHQSAIAELLRHFWSCFPARTAKLEAKAHKMHQCLIEYTTKQLQELQQTLNSVESLGLVQHMQESISCASQHYHKWLAKKKASHKLAA